MRSDSLPVRLPSPAVSIGRPDPHRRAARRLDRSCSPPVRAATTRRSRRRPRPRGRHRRTRSSARSRSRRSRLTSTKVGCFSGVVDGIVGPVTRAGIGAFQDAEGLTVDEEFGPATKQKLNDRRRTTARRCARSRRHRRRSDRAAVHERRRPRRGTGRGRRSPTSGARESGRGRESTSMPTRVDTRRPSCSRPRAVAGPRSIARSTACPRATSPPSIYDPGCTTN